MSLIKINNISRKAKYEFHKYNNYWVSLLHTIVEQALWTNRYISIPLYLLKYHSYQHDKRLTSRVLIWWFSEGGFCLVKSESGQAKKSSNFIQIWSVFFSLTYKSSSVSRWAKICCWVMEQEGLALQFFRITLLYTSELWYCIFM